MSFVEIALQYLTPYISTWESEVKCETFAMTVVLTFKLNWNYKLQTGGKKNIRCTWMGHSKLYNGGGKFLTCKGATSHGTNCLPFAGNYM